MSVGTTIPPAWRERLRSARTGQGWLIELVVILGVILALSAVLPERVALMRASPHPFWLPVIATALVHGTWPGIGAAMLSGVVAWLHGGGPVHTEEDFYDQMFQVFREPILWLFCALLLGAFRDRIEEERLRLAGERDAAREDLGRVVDYATALRGRIDGLEREIVLGERAPRAAMPPRPLREGARDPREGAREAGPAQPALASASIHSLPLREAGQ